MTTLSDVGLVALVCLAASCAQDSGSGGSQAHPAVADLAGNYIRQDTLHQRTDSLMLIRDGHFIRTVTSRKGDASYEGSIEWKDGVLHLPRPPDLDRTGLFDLEAEGDYRVVEWGDRIYLVEAVDLLRFCNAVNTGSEPRSESRGRFYLRKLDWDKPVAGLPQVPASWTEMLLASRLEGRTGEPDEAGRAWIGLGADEGLKPGMMLKVHDVPLKSSVIEMSGLAEGDMHVDLVTIESHRSLVQLHETWMASALTSGLRVTAGTGLRVTARAIDR